MVSIKKILNPSLVLFLEADSRDEAITVMVDRIDALGYLSDKNAFLDAIVEREKIVSTGIGMGVAIPHAKLASYKDFFIALGIFSKGIDWGALDNQPVRIALLIGGPADSQTQYLQILSNLTLAIKDETRRKKILTLNSKEAIIALFEGY